MRRDMTKTTKWVCAQRRLRLACASVQSDQSFAVHMKKAGGPLLPTERTADAQADLSHIMRKPVSGGCDQVKFKLACSAIEAS